MRWPSSGSGLPTSRMAFVSSNAWDAQAAAHAGFQVFWCNRSGQPPEYGLDGLATTMGGLGGAGGAARLSRTAPMRR